MAKHKKRKKLARRARQTASGGPSVSRPVPIEVTADEPVTRVATPAPDKPAPEEVTATFKETAKRGADGIDAEVATIEYPAIRRDLRKLGVTFTFFAAVIAGLALLNANSTVLADLGHQLFGLWQ